jgi:hypothetical protein
MGDWLSRVTHLEMGARLVGVDPELAGLVSFGNEIVAWRTRIGGGGGTMTDVAGMTDDELRAIEERVQRIYRNAHDPFYVADGAGALADSAVDLCAEVRRLQERVAELEGASPWIPCSERVPGVSEDVSLPSGSTITVWPARSVWVTGTIEGAKGRYAYPVYLAGCDDGDIWEDADELVVNVIAWAPMPPAYEG